jgi:hypothetical protein
LSILAGFDWRLSFINQVYGHKALFLAKEKYCLRIKTSGLGGDFEKARERGALLPLVLKM